MYSGTSSIWEITSLLPGESATLTLYVRSLLQRVYTLSSEIISTREPDRDSYPNNHLVYEDDITENMLRVANSGLISSPSA